MKRILVLTSLIIVVVSTMASARTYKIGVPAWVGFSPANVADVQGFWKAEGLEVKVFTFANPDEALKLFKTGVVDIGFEMIGNAIGLYMEGVPLTILAETDWSHGGDKILVKQDVDMATFSGKPLGIYMDQPSVTYFLHQYLTDKGLQLSDTRIIAMEPDKLTTHFIEGQLDMIVNYDPEALRAERDGNGKIVATSATYEGSIPEGMIVLNHVLKGIPHEDLIKIFRGWVKAVTWSQNPDNWKEYAEILNTSTFKDDAPYADQDLQGMLAAVRIHDVTKLLERNQENGGLYAYVNDVKAFLEANNMLEKHFSPEEIINTAALAEALKTLQ